VKTLFTFFVVTNIHICGESQKSHRTDWDLIYTCPASFFTVETVNMLLVFLY